jgi:predicted permease
VPLILRALAGIVDAVVPAGLFVLAGYTLRRRLGVDLRAVSRVALYIFSPALVLSSLGTGRLPWADVLGVAGFAGAMVVAGLAIARGVGGLWRVGAGEQAALDLTTVFPNSANLGLPIVTFALGADSVRAAVLFVLTQIVLINSVGAYLAGRVGVSASRALRRLVGLPAIWVALAAMALHVVHGAWPAPVLAAARFGGQAYAPTVLVVLGGTLADWRLAQATRVTWGALALRLAIMPMVGWAVTRVLRLDPATAAAVVLQTAMPAAVNTLVLAQEFDAEAGAVGGVVGLSTVMAAVTVPVWLATRPWWSG